MQLIGLQKIEKLGALYLQTYMQAYFTVFARMAVGLREVKNRTRNSQLKT